jgi:lipopolysaccharide/colanic/teichoic acid biosynthesis glycosyltransferase
MNTEDAFSANRGRYKPWFDRILLVSAHLPLIPLWVLLWTVIPLLVWLGDRGPIFFRQERMGLNGQPFTVLKFRTMVPDAMSKGPAWTVTGDPRVTRVGKILRRTALDELPELISILRGQMSFVGPRALGVEEYEKLREEIPGFEKRLRVMPGLTGLAQVYNKSDSPLGKFAYDLQYIEQMGFWLDVKLILLSVTNTLTARWDERTGKSDHRSYSDGTLPRHPVSESDPNPDATPPDSVDVQRLNIDPPGQNDSQ